jgi:FkbM family methyltransferase
MRVDFSTWHANSMKRLIKAVLARTPYRIVRDQGGNRFQAIEAALAGMKNRGFDPDIVIDGGAHLGSFSLMAETLFPRAEFHLIEPQAACLPHLRRLCAQKGFVLYEQALAEESKRVLLTSGKEPNTGAHVAQKPDQRASEVNAIRLDDLFVNQVRGRNALLKLDLQGYELFALRGAESLLPSVEVILTEVSFFSQAYEPSIVELLSFLNERDFELYDIASITGRSRDNRARQGDFILVRKGSVLASDRGWC